MGQKLFWIASKVHTITMSVVPTSELNHRLRDYFNRFCGNTKQMKVFCSTFRTEVHEYKVEQNEERNITW